MRPARCVQGLFVVISSGWL